MGNGGAHGCGQCLPCRLKRRREITHRIMLEAGLKQDNAFVTLTYEKDPVSLVPADLRAFFDALRKKVGYRVFRYYAVGEYGDQSMRPHYHVALFGMATCLRPSGRSDCNCRACVPISEAWGRGLIKNLPLEIGSARYIARYTIKKMTRTDDPRLGNRHPEFTRQSLKPGIGYGVLDKVADTIVRYNLLSPQGDVPVTLRHGTQEYPLGRYLRSKLRVLFGRDHRSPHVLSAEAAYAFYHSPEQTALRVMQEAARTDSDAPTLKAQLVKASRTRRENLARRHKLFGKKYEL